MRKILSYAGFTIFIIALLAVGGYHYMLNRYAGEIDNLMGILLAETAEEGETPESMGSLESPENQDSQAGTGNPLQETAENENNGAPAGTETPEKDTSGHTPGSGALTELENKYPAFKNIELKDQLFAVQMIRKYSAAELQEMYQLYSEGKKSRGELLGKLKEKISSEELQRIKEVFQRNKGLL